ncbi:MAG: hypothetical protein COS34_09175 [Lysobacterales bacterium CG02_land_8_20_14_3_00_62_12]|nr:MAG: hypothetical protein COS34_09175 [Xanthomonadales bacterium CG02_land_8_20_14_3_00_62_12]
MNLETLIPPTDLRDYAKDQGWVLLKEAAKDRLYVMTNPSFERRQLVFPMDTTAPDYSEAVMLVVGKLAAMEGRSAQAVIKNLLEVGDDAIAFRVTTPRPDDRSLPLSFAGSMVTGAQQLLLASACTVLKPQAHHPRLSRTEAQQFLETAKFRHTQPGSFVLNVSCPVQGLDVQAPLLPDEADAPFVRRTTATLRKALGELVTAIETDSLDAFVEATKNGANPLVSSNLCEALTRFEDSSLKNSVEIGITWAAAIPKPANEGRVSIIRIQHGYFPRIEEVRRELRSKEQHLEDVFPATVERLDGEMGEDSKRSGEVILRLLTPDGDELVRARANLTADQYKLADEAHMTDGAFVKVAGKLHPGRQPRQLSDIKSFELMLK